MNGLLAAIAARHLLARKRQSAVSLMGIVLGVAFFLSISAMMQGSDNDLVHRLVDNAPHITISDQYRSPHEQPAQQLFKSGVVELFRVKPETETRGIRGYQQILDYLRTFPGLQASPLLNGKVLANFAGKDVAISLSGMIPSEVNSVSTIRKFMVAGDIDNLAVNPDGILIGDKLADDLSLSMDENLTITATTGQSHTFKIVGMFHTGRADYDDGQAIVTLKRAQALLNRANRANSIIIKLVDANFARTLAAEIENHIGYKSVSWQEASEDLMSVLFIRKVIMYSVVSAVLVVAAFGIYNVISTVVLEKRRDIAILKSMGFCSRDVRRIFLMQGFILGVGGSIGGCLLGSVFMWGLSQLSFKVPGATDRIFIVISWHWFQYALAASFALASASLAAFIPARKAAMVHPVDILRGTA